MSTESQQQVCPRCGSHKLAPEEAAGYSLQGRYACGGFGEGYAQTPACKVIAGLRDELDKAVQTMNSMYEAMSTHGN